MSDGMIRRLSLVLPLLLAVQSQAESFRQSWDPVPNADAYEFEIFDDSRLKKENLIQTGRSNVTDIELDLRPGVYFIRVRSLDSKGKPSPWSPPIRNAVRVSPPVIRTPLKNETMYIPGAQGSVAVEWTSVESATRYEARLWSKNGFGQTQSVQAPYAVFSKIPAGSYQLRVQAWNGDALISSSETHPVSIRSGQRGRPRFLFPQDGDTLTAFEMHRIRWTRANRGDSSEIIFTRMDGADRRTLSRERMSGRSWALTPPLPEGRYQITVRDYFPGSEDSVDATVTVFVEKDPLGQHAESIYANARLTLGPRFGRRTLQSHLLKREVPDSNGNNEQPASGGNGFSQGTTGFLDLKLHSRIWSPWGAEIRFITLLGGETFQIQNDHSRLGTNGFSQSDEISRSKLYLGPTYRHEPWGPHRPFLFKTLLFSQKQQSLIPQPEGSSGLRFKTDPFDTEIQLYGLRAGAEYRHGGWSTRYDWITEFNWDYPFLRSARPLAARGRLDPLSSAIDGQIFLRRKVSSELRLSLGFHGALERLRINDDEITPTDFRRREWGLRLALDWDL